MKYLTLYCVGTWVRHLTSTRRPRCVSVGPALGCWTRAKPQGSVASRPEELRSSSVKDPVSRTHCKDTQIHTYIHSTQNENKSKRKRKADIILSAKFLFFYLNFSLSVLHMCACAHTSHHTHTHILTADSSRESESIREISWVRVQH